VKPRFITESFLYAVAKWLVAVFALWTLAYEIVLAGRFAAYAAVVIFLVAAAASLALWFFLRARPKSSGPPEGSPRNVIAALLILAAVCAFLSLVVSRPDVDDVDFFHRPLVQSRHLDLPVILYDTTHNVEGLASPTTMHLLASYETAVAFAARFLHLDPLSLYQNSACAAASFLVPIVYFLLARRLGLAPAASFFTSLGAAAFLWFDGNLHASFGNYAFVRLWQGKCILLTLLCPLAAVFALDYWHAPSWRTWLPLLLAGIAGLGLSGTALFAMPVLVFILSIALAADDIIRQPYCVRRALANALILNLSSAYCACISAGFLLGLIPQLRDIALSQDIYRATESWIVNIRLTLGQDPSILWYAALLVFGPLLSPAPRKTFIVLLWSLAGVALCFNPLTGPLWLAALHTVYWRLLFLLPVALSAGLVFAGAASLLGAPLRRPAVFAKALLVLVLAVLFIRHFSMATFSTSNFAFLKSPLAWRSDPVVLRFASQAVPFLKDRNLLAPQEVAAVLPLLEPSIRLETQRAWVTEVLFTEVLRKPDEAARRLNAQALVAGQKSSPAALAAFETSIRSGVDAVVAANAAVPAVEPVLARADGGWRRACSGADYTLFIRE
jgi:hypothetical protein